MSGATFRYHVVSPDVQNLEKEVNNVSDDVDVFEISGTLCRKLIRSVGKGLFGGKPLLVKLHADIDDMSADVLPIYLDITDSVSMPVQAVLASDPVVLKEFNVEVDLTEVTDVDELTQQLSDVKALTLPNLCVRANISMLESFKGCGLDVSVDLASVTQESVDDVVARAGGAVSTFVFKSGDALSPDAEVGVGKLENVMEEYQVPVVLINEIVRDLESLGQKYDEEVIPKIQEKIKRVDFNPNVNLYFETKLKFIKDYVEYKIKATEYQLAHLEHKITMMSRANDAANLEIKSRVETDDERRKQLRKELNDYELESAAKFDKLQEIVDSIAITFEGRQEAEESCDELLKTYKSLTVLYYNFFDEFNVLKTGINRDVREVENRLGPIINRCVKPGTSQLHKEKVKTAKELVQKVTPVRRAQKTTSFFA